MFKLSILFTLFTHDNHQKVVKIGKTVAAVGAAMSVLGAIFYLQGQSVVGPQSSFMYANPEWITHGLEILGVGAAIFALGIMLAIKRV